MTEKSNEEPVSSVPATTPEAEHVQAEDTANIIEAYHAVAEWIRFADAKSGVVLTVSAALAGILIPTIRPIIDDPEGIHLIPMWKAAALSFFALFLIFLILSGVAAFRCINPFRLRGKHPSLERCSHFHPAAISDNYKIDQEQEFVRDCNQGGVVKFREEVLTALLIDSHISNSKYQRVSSAIHWFTISVAFAFLYLLTIQL